MATIETDGGAGGYTPRSDTVGPRRNPGPDFFVPEVPRARWELPFSEFDCGSQIDVDRSKRRCIFVGWRPAIIGLKVFFVPCAGRLASPIFHRWMTLSIYRWIALPKALWFSNPYHFFRCKTCGGYLDARDLVWIEDH